MKAFSVFAARLRRMGRKAYRDMPTVTIEALIKDQFIESLEDDMYKHVGLAKPASLDIAVGMAADYESHSNRSTKQLAPKPKMIAAMSMQSAPENTQFLQSAPENIQSWKSVPDAFIQQMLQNQQIIMQQFQQQQSQNGQSQRRNATFKGECFHCKKERP